MRQGKEGSGRGRGGGRREGGDRKEGRRWMRDVPALFKLLNTPLALLQGPALCLDSLLIYARHERRAMSKSKDDHPV